MEITADGKPLKPGAELLPIGTQHVELGFTRDASAPALSYASAVKQYKKDFRTHYEEFVRTGK